MFTAKQLAKTAAPFPGRSLAASSSNVVRLLSSEKEMGCSARYNSEDGSKYNVPCGSSAMHPRCRRRSVSRSSLNNISLLHRSTHANRRYSSQAGGSHKGSEGPTSKRAASLFSSKDSAWDHVFDNVSDVSPLIPRSPPPAGRVVAQTRDAPRRQAMTARELSAFDEMFKLIFNTATDRKSLSESWSEGTEIPDTAIGSTGGNDVGDLFINLRRRARTRHTVNEDAELDRKKEEMELCQSDMELLDWAAREVFGESERYEKKAKALALAEKNGGEVKRLPLQPPGYAELLAALIRTYRERYRDPHLALSIFSHAQHLSIPSYVFGCTTPAYNELIETRWTCFQDLRGVYEALEEMKANGVPTDGRTRTLVELVRREVGERNLWAEEDEVGSGEVWVMLNAIERLVAPRKTSSHFIPPGIASNSRPSPGNSPVSIPRGAWKDIGLENDAGGDWEFGKWPERPSGRRMPSH